MNERITKASANAIALITHFEDFRAGAYLCPAGVWTIGYGTTRYPDGSRVTKGDKCNEIAAVNWLKNDISSAEIAVDNCTRDDVNQNEFDALIDFSYNLGSAALPQSKLNKVVNMRSEDAELIEKCFGMWNKARVNGRLVELDGLTRRRKSEANLYLTGTLNFYE